MSEIKSSTGDGLAVFAAKYPDLNRTADRYQAHRDPNDRAGRDAMNIRDGFETGYNAACDLLSERLTDLSQEITELRTRSMGETLKLLDELKTERPGAPSDRDDFGAPCPNASQPKNGG